MGALSQYVVNLGTQIRCSDSCLWLAYTSSDVAFVLMHASVVVTYRSTCLYASVKSRFTIRLF